MTNRPVLCGKCGTSSDKARPFVTTDLAIDPDGTSSVVVVCGNGYCGHSVSSDSLPAALAKFEEPVK